jgi:hypothetical protein
MANERKEFRETEKNLLEMSAGDLITMLENNEKLIHVKQTAFKYYSDKNKEFFEVQVTVTRHEIDFLEAFQTEEMEGYTP